ncbi:hypothetical protein [Tardiphaga sp. 11_C7_N12_6]|uniref:hypothetical protein n=1 Tax=Tardiphaga sp. 11_C7_N12_6 TaxID=3240789 RepID=UPI003F24A54A
MATQMAVRSPRLLKEMQSTAFYAVLFIAVLFTAARASDEDGPLELLKVSIKCLVEPVKVIEDDHVTYSQDRIAYYVGDARSFGIVVTRKENILWDPVRHNEYTTRDSVNCLNLETVKVKDSLLTLQCKSRKDCNRLQATMRYDQEFDLADECERSRFCKEGKLTKASRTSSIVIRFCSDAAATDAADAIKELMRLAIQREKPTGQIK